MMSTPAMTPTEIAYSMFLSNSKITVQVSFTVFGVGVRAVGLGVLVSCVVVAVRNDGFGVVIFWVLVSCVEVADGFGVVIVLVVVFCVVVFCVVVLPGADRLMGWQRYEDAPYLQSSSANRTLSGSTFCTSM